MKPWDTDLSIVLFETGDLSTEAVVGGLTQVGWACMGTRTPPLVQLILDPLAGEAVEHYLRDLDSVVRRLRSGKDVAKGDLGYAD